MRKGGKQLFGGKHLHCAAKARTAGRKGNASSLTGKNTASSKDQLGGHGHRHGEGCSKKIYDSAVLRGKKGNSLPGGKQHGSTRGICRQEESAISKSKRVRDQADQKIYKPQLRRGRRQR